ncbi:DUF3153 domain-containing protein [Nodosilinea nodulosa]|uniref:DUF3153 domain-containing protein n=1 Tax=Nodosilinea nodulosa TaxID=416001 RepID=UPI0002F836D3|nr:DUF3153 domain-containing protein [Nodosilinea nodulosa]
MNAMGDGYFRAASGAWRQLLKRLPLLLLPLVLSGCLRYDLTLRFDHHTHGQISQTIALSDRGAALAQPTLAPWLEALRLRSRPLGGQLSQGPQTITLTVPFGTAQDLTDRFQQLWAEPAPAPDSDPGPATARSADIARPTYLELPGWGAVPFDLSLDQTNWVLASRTHLTYTLDLRDLPANAADSATPPWADLRFRLQVPWGLAKISPAAASPLAKDAGGAVWQLEPGQITRIEAVFWLPNAIALGTLGIVALVLGGYGLRYRVLKSAKTFHQS